MTPEDLERFEATLEMSLYREYRDVVAQFEWVVETERRFYLANSVAVTPNPGGFFEVELTDAWVWDMYRPARFVKTVRVLTFKDVNVERLDKPDLELPQP
jgi:predicted Rdx family selenoprotein